MAEHRRTPVALTIAGSDSSGGAGIQADLKTFAAFGVYGASVVTALTAQNTRGVTGVLAVPPSFIEQQIEAVVGDLRVGAVKTGMLGDADTVRCVIEAIRRHGLKPLVVDPVMVATSGDVLLAEDAIELVRAGLAPLATVLTPNLHEAARLTGGQVAATEVEMARQGRALLALGAQHVLVKGGHSAGEAVDLLVSADGVVRLPAARIETRHTHGTGCTLSAGIAASLARGHSVPDAVLRAKTYVWRALEAGQDLAIGGGNGPVDHRVRPAGETWGD